MRLRVDSLSLVGADRRFVFQPGLNVIAGPIATGKTTLVRCIRGLLAGDLDRIPPEARATIQTLAGKLTIGEADYDIIRPFVTTRDARVEVAGADVAERLPVYRSTNAEEPTYREWLLGKLRLPKIQVPRAPTQRESELSPVTIQDYLMYCQLQQDEIDSSVFGHTDYYKNTKRMAVFEIYYGRYDVELAGLREQLREIYAELRRLRSWSKTVEEFLSGTPFENEAAIERGIRETETKLEQFESKAGDLAERAAEQTTTTELREELRHLDSRAAELHRAAEFEAESIEQKGSLVAQLRTQSARLTKAIVAEDYLLDFDFLMCPRCGSEVNIDRSRHGECYLCLQHPQHENIRREELVQEQDRLEGQIAETRDLLFTSGTAALSAYNTRRP